MILHYTDENVIEELTLSLNELIEHKLKINNYSDIKIVCIGTDKVIYDALGPLVGEFLQDHFEQYPINYVKVYGTLQKPIHALNIKKFIKDLDSKDSLIIAIDAYRGTEDMVGEIITKLDSVKPGLGAGRELPSIGEIAIKGITLSDDDETLFNNTRLSFIYNMAKVISSIIINSVQDKIKYLNKIALNKI